MATRRLAACVALAAALMAGATARAAAQSVHPDVPPEATAERFPAVGVALGSPGYVNLTASYHLPRVALRVSGGSGGHRLWGAQGDLVWRMHSAESFSTGVALVAGAFAARDIDSDDEPGEEVHHQRYVGVALDLFLAGFRLQTGLAHGLRAYPQNPQLLVQFGYELRLR